MAPQQACLHWMHTQPSLTDHTTTLQGAAGWASDSDDEGGAALHIGGVRVRVDRSGTGRASMEQPRGGPSCRQRNQADSLVAGRPAPPRMVGGGSSSGEEMEDGDRAALDYLENLGAADAAEHGSGPASGSSGSQADTEGGSAAKRRRRQVRLGLQATPPAPAPRLAHPSPATRHPRYHLYHSLT